MTHPTIWRGVAERYHRDLPPNIRRYLNDRGIPDKTVDKHLLGWSGRRITIPVFGREGELLQIRYAKAPDDASEAPKVLSQFGAETELYGWDTLARNPHRVIICEGEYDRLALEAQGFRAVTSTGGAKSFRKEWASAFARVVRIYICFDRDDAGEEGAKRVQAILPQATIVKLPAEVGPKGDVTDFFVALGRTHVDFEMLLAAAAAAEAPTTAEPSKTRPARSASKADRRRADWVRKNVSLAAIVENYTELRASGAVLVARCPLRKEKSPSFTVYPAKNNFHCYGCGANGDAITFLELKESMSFKAALDVLERYHLTHELFGTAA
jgi:CHC2-type zinc finger protein/Toprim domain-containing protein